MANKRRKELGQTSVRRARHLVPAAFPRVSPRFPPAFPCVFHVQEDRHGGEELARCRELDAAVNLLPKGQVAHLSLAVVVEWRALGQVEEHQRDLVVVRTSLDVGVSRVRGVQAPAPTPAPTSSALVAATASATRSKAAATYEVVRDVGERPSKLGREERDVREHETEDEHDDGVARPPTRMLNPRGVGVRLAVDEGHSQPSPAAPQTFKQRARARVWELKRRRNVRRDGENLCAYNSARANENKT